MDKLQKTATILSNERIQGDYFKAVFKVEEIPALVQPGQFVHLHLPDFEHRVLRRPFSIFDVDTQNNTLSIIYKVVGEGTEHLSKLNANSQIDMLGPLGTPFSPLPDNSVIVAGGYGCAATHIAAKLATTKPTVLIGGRTKGDILLQETYEALGCKVLISTDDGSYGLKGRVTDLLTPMLPQKPWCIACGPLPMMYALAKIMKQNDLSGELSLDSAMCCGVGACFACVTKVVADNPDGWRYARVCHEGPVFPLETLYLS